MKPSFLNRTLGKIGLVRKEEAKAQIETVKRSYAAAAINRLTNDWSTAITSGDTEIRNDAVKLRARSREMERDNDYIERYFKALINNVLGSSGIQLHMQIENTPGVYDTEANKKISDAWAKWCKKENCTVTGTMSMLDAQQIALRSTARDGGFLVRKVKAPVNPFNFALQLIEIDHLDYTYSMVLLPNGNEVRNGIELNKWRKPVAYYLWTRHPGDYYSPQGFQRERIPADEIIHLYRPTRTEQAAGAPWTATAMLRLHMLGRYEEAELVAAREAACKGGFFTHKTPDHYEGDSTDANGNQISEMEPGTYEDLPMNTEFIPLDPQHPTQAFPFFQKAMLRGAASGLGMSYNTLASDLEGVNYSSIRAGLLDEREEWKMTQNWFIDDFCEEVFKEWLPLAIMTGQINLPFSKIDKFENHEWKARRWPWVDPLKDMEANVLAVEKGFDSRRNIISEAGGNIETVFKEQGEDKKLAELNKLDFSGQDPEPLVKKAESPTQI
jgi:lambda family phage portal protein